MQARTRRALATTAVLCAAAGVGVAQAQPWPAKPLRMVVPFPPGGGTDAIARQFAAQLAETLGQPVMVDNRAGAGGNVGAEVTARATPDGYTIMLSSSSLAINAALGQKLTYSVTADLAPLALVASAPLVLAVHPIVPVTTVRELVALARKRRG